MADRKQFDARSLDNGEALQSQVRAAFESKEPLDICGGNSKAFYGHKRSGESLDVTAHRGIIHYAPEELVITARAGTPLSEIEATLAKQHQMLAFEPSHFGGNATLGGTIAAGLSGPRRPWSGSARDFALGMTLLNGRGERMSFGGEVMKNVAGYDVTRLQCGAMGTLGVILDVSLKVLPSPEAELTLSYERTLEESLNVMTQWRRLPLPISASSWYRGRHCVRFSGAASAVSMMQKRLGGEQLDSGSQLWSGLREQSLPFFHADGPLWRISLPHNSPHLVLSGVTEDHWLIEWGGAQRWLSADVDGMRLRREVEKLGGHATLFRCDDRATLAGQRFHPLAAGGDVLHRNLKKAFDPQAILNPGRLYSEL